MQSEARAYLVAGVDVGSEGSYRAAGWQVAGSAAAAAVG